MLANIGRSTKSSKLPIRYSNQFIKFVGQYNIQDTAFAIFDDIQVLAFISVDDVAQYYCHYEIRYFWLVSFSFHIKSISCNEIFIPKVERISISTSSAIIIDSFELIIRTDRVSSKQSKDYINIAKHLRKQMEKVINILVRK